MKEKIKTINKSKKSNLDKTVKISIIVGVLLVGFSFLFFNVVKPILDEKKLNDCLDRTEKITDGFFGLGKNTKDVKEAKEECFKKYPQ